VNDDQFQRLCSVCDSVLRSKLTKERIAIDWLHVLNEHPVHIDKYINLFNGMSSDTLRWAKSLAQSILQTMKCIKSKPMWHSSKKIPDRADVIIISHLISESQVGLEEDFYFGRLSESLQGKGLSTVVVLRDHTGGNLKKLSSKWPSSMAPRLFFSNSLSCREELLIRKHQKEEASLLLKEAKLSSDDLKKRVLKKAASLADSGSPIAMLRFYKQLEGLIERLRPKTIIVTYEGHAWERLVFSAARNKVPNIRCIGYQHAILFPRHHALKRELGGGFDPDVILTGGDVTRDILLKDKSFMHTKVTTIGTHRQDTPNRTLTEKLSKNMVDSCLVIPDGNLCECLTILKFSIDVAKAAPNIHFIIRFHPLISFETIVKADRKLEVLPDNLEVSQCSINEDFDRCRWALYRASGAAIRAVVDGLRPFYISLPHELNIDPLYTLTDWKCVISTPKEFIEQARLDLKCNSSILENELIKAREFCQSYFKPVDLDGFYYEIKA